MGVVGEMHMMGMGMGIMGLEISCHSMGCMEHGGIGMLDPITSTY